MQTECDRRFADELLEKYSIGHLSDEQITTVEEHILLCSDCQERLTSIDQFVHVAKAAAAELERKRTAPKRDLAELLGRLWPIPKPMWALGLATASLAVLVSVPVQQGRQTELVLTASRGQAASTPHARSLDKLLLRIDTTTLPAAPVYRLQLVNATGREVWKSDVIPQGNRQIVAEAPSLSRGKYWVRIYSGTDSETALQEYGVAIE